MRVYPPRGPGDEPFHEPDWESRDFVHASHLRILHEYYEATANPVHAIEAIVYSYDAGLAPPVWAMDWLVPGFQKYLDSRGECDLRKVLGLSGKQGKGMPVKDHLREESNRSRVGFPAYVLQRIYGLDNEPALEAVTKREAAKYPEESQPNCGDAYKRKWKKQFKSDWDGTVMDLFRSQKHRQEFIDSFPDDALPTDKADLMAESDRRVDRPHRLP